VRHGAGRGRDALSSDSDAPEAPRDEAESGFTQLLRLLRCEHSEVLAAVFVDRMGECIDYSSQVAPFEAKVAGAVLVPVALQVRLAIASMAGGEVSEIAICGTRGDVLVRRLDDEYMLVLVGRPGMADGHLAGAIEASVDGLRREAMIGTPVWDDARGPLIVFVRSAVGWDYAPDAFRHGETVGHITDVLGKWEESGGAIGGELVCFRVVTDVFAEITLAFDPDLVRWFEWKHELTG